MREQTGATLRQHRTAFGHSQSQAANLLKVSAALVSLIERGLRRPGLGLAYRIQAVYGIHPVEWLEEVA